MATGAIAIEMYAAAVGKNAIHIRQFARSLQLAGGDLWPIGESRRGGLHEPIHCEVHHLVSLMLAHIAAPYASDSGLVVRALRSVPFLAASRHELFEDGRRAITPILNLNDMPTLFPTCTTFGATLDELVRQLGEG